MPTQIEHMWATCLHGKGTLDLIEGNAYHVLDVKVYKRFGETAFYILENGKAYASCHFSVTYPLKREIGKDFK